jgi:hypothetical protein
MQAEPSSINGLRELTATSNRYFRTSGRLVTQPLAKGYQLGRHIQTGPRLAEH